MAITKLVERLVTAHLACENTLSVAKGQSTTKCRQETQAHDQTQLDFSAHTQPLHEHAYWQHAGVIPEGVGDSQALILTA